LVTSKKVINQPEKYSDLIAEWLVDFGYSRCFSLGGGNIMHLTDSVSRRLELIPVVHEITAGIAAEYQNECSTKKAFALVTTGPGLTNIVTAIAGAQTESRELLVIGGQVKTTDLASGLVRQRGIQEIDGVEIVAPISKISTRLLKPIPKDVFLNLVRESWSGRKGVVFIEIPIDVQGQTVNRSALETKKLDYTAHHIVPPANLKSLSKSNKLLLVNALRKSKRPVLLLGGGISRQLAAKLKRKLALFRFPIMTTYNGADRVDSRAPNYFGRPNTWGMRYSNILIQQADLLIALGTRLGLQQTGFNFREFVPKGQIIQVDIDPSELTKGHPSITHGIQADANEVLTFLSDEIFFDYDNWLSFCKKVKKILPVNEVNSNKSYSKKYISPYTFYQEISEHCRSSDIVIPCSSGGAFTCAYQSFLQKSGQILISNKSLASMGYGLAGAFGVSTALQNRRVILFEGDGGFAQNMPELGSVSRRNLWLKIFIFDDDGYASIRATQRSYFKGRYVGCDVKTGLKLPKWEAIQQMFNIPVYRISQGFVDKKEFHRRFERHGPDVFLVTIHPEQSYYPKISSRVLPSGCLESNPLHLMTPEISKELREQVMPHIGDI
jgi:acetolactate synthase-1/2/3 large subunit